LNQQCCAKFEQEREFLQPLPKYRVPDYEILTARVSSRSTVEVRCVLYTVPSRLIGHQLELHLYHDRIVGYLGNHQVVELPRIRVTNPDKRRGRCINYRHVIEGLHRKPKAFIYCTWQQELLPTPAFRELWQRLTVQFNLDLAAVLMVEALYIAGTQNQETAVADYLDRELTAQTLTLKGLQQQWQQDYPDNRLPQLTVIQHDLASYDQLLEPQPPHHSSDPEPKPADGDNNSPESPPVSNTPSQATAADSHALTLGIDRTPSYAGKMVLCAIFAGIVRTRNHSPQCSKTPTRFVRGSTPHRKKFFQL
jgi:hypothetical protein